MGKPPHNWVNPHRIGQLVINSLRNRFEQLSTMISGNIDNFMMSESKLDETFPAAQFLLQGFSMPYRLDRNRNGDMFYIREDTPSRLIKRKVRNNVEYFFVEINLRQKK